MLKKLHIKVSTNANKTYKIIKNYKSKVKFQVVRKLYRSIKNKKKGITSHYSKKTETKLKLWQFDEFLYKEKIQKQKTLLLKQNKSFQNRFNTHEETKNQVSRISGQISSLSHFPTSLFEDFWTTMDARQRNLTSVKELKIDEHN